LPTFYHVQLKSVKKIVFNLKYLKSNILMTNMCINNMLKVSDSKPTIYVQFKNPKYKKK